MSLTIRLKNPFTVLDGTGIDATPNSPNFGLQQQITVISALQAVESSSNVKFGSVTSPNPFLIDNSGMILSDGSLTGSFSQSGLFEIQNNLTHNGDLVVKGTLTAESLRTEHGSSIIIFKSGSTRFGDDINDKQTFTGSLNISGSIFNGITDISNDSTFSGSSTTALPTEDSILKYYGEKNLYLRKISANIAAVDTTSTASFNAVTASAPSGLSNTTKNDFMFFCNGMIMEQDALSIEQSGSKLLLKVDTNNIGYELQSIALGAPTTDEIVGWGKFN